MNEKHIKLFLVILLGWMVGYFHHHFATKPHNQALEAQNLALVAKVQELSFSAEPVKKVMVKATAYSNDAVSINVPAWLDDKTATNTKPRKGIVAADWRLFPPGTRLFIPGYGEAVVEDRGGAVKGNHLDLFMDSYEEARQWGVREVYIYVIKKGRAS